MIVIGWLFFRTFECFWDELCSTIHDFIFPLSARLDLSVVKFMLYLLACLLVAGLEKSLIEYIWDMFNW
jgi:hypothetical protein